MAYYCVRKEFKVTELKNNNKTDKKRDKFDQVFKKSVKLLYYDNLKRKVTEKCGVEQKSN